MNDLSGWVKLHRSILTWEWFTDVNTAHFFEYCIVKANHDDDTWRGISIKRGSFLSSYETMRVESGLSVQKIRTSIKKLKSTGEITSESTNNYTIITVCNYNNYQIEFGQEQQAVQQAVQQAAQQAVQHASQQQTRNKEEKNKEDKKEDTNVSSKKFSFKNEIIALGVDEQVADDWIMVRKNKKLSQTQTAFNHTKKNIETISSTHNLSANEIIRTAVERSWGGVEPDFFKNIPAKGQQDLFSPIQNESYSPAGIKYQ